MKYYLAIDIGASSGRHIIGYKKDNTIEMEEIYRFPNGVKEVDGHLTWDIDHIFNEVKNGIKKCLEKYPNIESMSIDTWGVDYVLLNGNEEIRPVYAYRDNRTNNSIDKVHEIIPFSRLYEITGSQFATFNTIYQLYADKLANRLEKATDFLMIPEYLMYKLTGNKKKEYTNAGTMGMFDAKTNKVSKEIIDKLGLNNLNYDVYKPGTEVGYFKEDIQKEVNGNIKVVLCPTHDTAAAVEGINMEGNHPYISSGTWSLLGIKNDIAITSSVGMEKNYSNEYGPDYIRVQKNIMGLWIIQNLGKLYNMDPITMVNECETSTYEEIFDVNDSCFLAPKNMEEAIRNYYEERKTTPPNLPKDFIRTTYNSLAYSYKVAIEELEAITNKKYDCIYIVGGGAKNRYLNKMTEYFTNKKVIAQPIEATALGNLKSQMEEN